MGKVKNMINDSFDNKIKQSELIKNQNQIVIDEITLEIEKLTNEKTRIENQFYCEYSSNSWINKISDTRFQLQRIYRGISGNLMFYCDCELISNITDGIYNWMYCHGKFKEDSILYPLPQTVSSNQQDIVNLFDIIYKETVRAKKVFDYIAKCVDKGTDINHEYLKQIIS